MKKRSTQKGNEEKMNYILCGTCKLHIPSERCIGGDNHTEKEMICSACLKDEYGEGLHNIIKDFVDGNTKYSE